MSSNQLYEFEYDNKTIKAGPETVVELYYGRGADRYNRAVADRPDLRDSFTTPDMPNPKIIYYDKNIVRILSGLAIPNAGLSPTEVIEQADYVRKTLPWTPKLLIAELPTQEVINDYRGRTGITVNPTPIDLAIQNFGQKIDQDEYDIDELAQSLPARSESLSTSPLHKRFEQWYQTFWMQDICRD